MHMVKSLRVSGVYEALEAGHNQLINEEKRSTSPLRFVLM